MIASLTKFIVLSNVGASDFENDSSRSSPRPSFPLNRVGSPAGRHRMAHTSHRLSPRHRHRAVLLAANQADTPHRTKSDGGTIDGTGDGEESDLWISCASRHACGCAPPLHGILETVEKAESHTRLHHLNICVPPCLPTGEPRRAKRNRISPRLSTRQAGRNKI